MKLGRLSRQSDIAHVRSKGMSIRSSLCGVRLLPLPEGSLSRAAFVISKKVDSRAVVRNRLRRQYREILRELLADMPHAYDFVVYPSKEAIEIPYADKKKALFDLFSRHGLMR